MDINKEQKIIKDEQIKKCQNCSCNRNRQCRGYTTMVNRKLSFVPSYCEFFTGKKKKPIITE